MAMLDDVSAGNVSFISVVIILGKPLLLRKFSWRQQSSGSLVLLPLE